MQPGACLLKGAPRRPFYEPLRKNLRSNQSLINKGKKRSLKVSQSLQPKLVSPFHRKKVVRQKVSNLNQMAIQLLLISTGATTYWASDWVLSYLQVKKHSRFFVSKVTNWTVSHLDRGNIFDGKSLVEIILLNHKHST